MKKILFSLVALVCSMSMNAQVMKVMKDGEVVATFSGAKYKFVFEKEQASSTTGTAKATIKGSEVDVKWTQLWPGGPKFAEKNVEGEMTFTNATKTGADYVWGANWCTPSKDDMDELVKAATDGSEKVKCEFVQEGTTYGFKFTGKETGYTGNSVFFPAETAFSDYGDAYYWSGTVAVDKGYAMNLNVDYGDWNSCWIPKTHDQTFFVRPLLAEKPTATTTGTAKRTGNIDVKWVQLWENGPKFAEYNVGVTDGKAEDYGGYYCWGKSIDKDSDIAFKGGADALTGTDDTATNLWGSAWRMPTKAELEALLANCDVEWTAVNGVNGRKFTGKDGYASNSVFLPAAGQFDGDDVLDAGDGGYYWSSMPDSSNYAECLNFSSGDASVSLYIREYGRTVRAVLAE